MAFPVIASQSSGVQTSNSSSWAYTLPTGLQVGDLLLVFVGSDGDSIVDIGSSAVTDPDLFNVIVSTGASATCGITVGYRIIDGTEGSTGTIGIRNNISSAAQNEQGCWLAVRITNWRGTATGVVGTRHASTESSGTSPDPISLDPNVWGIEDTLWFAAAASDHGNTTYTGKDANYTYVTGSPQESGGASGAALAVAYKENAVASEDPGAFTTDASEGWWAVTVAVRPKYVGWGYAQANAYIVKNWMFAQSMAHIGGQTSFTDTFTRTVSDGWGTSDSGSVWTPIDAPSKFAVNGTQATVDGTGGNIALNTVDFHNFETKFDFKTGTLGGVVTVLSRANPDVIKYHQFRIKTFVDGSVELRLLITDSGTAEYISTYPSSTMLADTFYTARLQILSTLDNKGLFRFKLWQTGQTEPDWEKSGIVDKVLSPEANQGGIIRFASVQSGYLLTFDNITIRQTILGSYGQAQSEITSSGITTIRAYAQTQAQIKQIYNQFAQAQSDTLQIYNVYSQTQAQIKQTYNGFGQAEVWIEQTYFGLGQTQSWIEAIYNSYAQAQSDIKQTYNAYAQSQAQIKQIYSIHAQANTWIEQTYNQFMQANAWIKATYNTHAQAQADILQTYYQHAQAQAEITGAITIRYTHSQAQAQILQVYVQHAQAQAWIEQTYNVFAQSQAQILQVYTVYGQSQADILQVYAVHSQAQAQIKQVYNAFAQVQGTILQTYNQYAQAQANILQTYFVHAQANASIANTYTQPAQAQGTILQTYNAFAQAQGTILTTYYTHAQAQANILQVYTTFAQAQSQILQTYFAHANAQAWIEQTYNAHANAQGTILAISNAYGQAQADILQTYYGFAQAQALILQTYYAFGQAQAHIITTYNQFAQAQGHILAISNAHGQSQAKLNAFDVNAFGQAQGTIRLEASQAYAQAQATIITTVSAHAQAQAQIYIAQHIRPVADISNTGWIGAVI